jgi:MtN3 and saliva related transmembrane protein
MDIHLIGWASSSVLLLTLSRQIWTEWKEKSARGVSIFLFLGQILSSIGFVIYQVSSTCYKYRRLFSDDLAQEKR